MFAPKFYPQINECEICMKNGTRRELLPLIRLRGVGRVRARRLFNNGMTSPEEIKKHPREEIARILGQGITDQIFEQLEPKNRSTDTTSVTGERPAGQSTLFRFG
jgi:helicase